MIRSAIYRACAILLVTAATAVSSSCVRSKVVVTSDPPGANVTMNGVNLGKTPVEHPFTWYWYYDFVAKKDGYETTGKQVRFHAPPWFWPVLDLVSEAVPLFLTDRKHVHLVLEPKDTRPAPAYSEIP